VEALLVAHKPNWAPRVIYKGTDVYNALSGPMFEELMKRMDHGMQVMPGPHRVKMAYKCGPLDYVPFLAGCSEKVLECDFSGNDKTQCADVQVLELMLMRRLGAPEWFCRLHSRTNQFQVVNYGHGARATLEHQLPTGATDTTFRNTFWNGCILTGALTALRARSSRSLLLGDDMVATVDGMSARSPAKTYEGVAKEAQMVARVKVHSGLVDASFLSRLFVPTQDGMYLTVPLLGKAIGRFNMRANQNAAVSNAMYFAGKAVGYAYEFRFCPDLRDVFLERFSREWDTVIAEGGTKPSLATLEISWQARSSGVTLANIKEKIFSDRVLSFFECHRYCLYRYGLDFYDVVDLFTRIVLTDHEDDDTIVGRILAADFMLS